MSKRVKSQNDSFTDASEINIQSHSNTCRFLVATDLHIGYGHRIPHCSSDSYRTFDEILEKAVENEVDFVLLGGDMFHHNVPPQNCLHRVIRMLRKRCYSSRPVAIRFLSDPAINFSHSAFFSVNFEDRDINVGLPIFCIHGNHDAPYGEGYTALDSLHECGFLNLFGRVDDINNFEMVPVLLQKGTTKLAIYGLGYQRDDRLCRAFREEKIRFLRPQEDTESWFNILVVHQNRPRRSKERSTGAHLPEDLLPTFFDLVIWGHEHECKIDPQYYEGSTDVAGDGFYIIQPGSTIATMLTREESLQKHISIIGVNGRKFCSNPIPLKTVRPLLFDQLFIDVPPPPECSRSRNTDNLVDEQLIIAKIKSMLEEHGKKNPGNLFPLMRLKVYYSELWNNYKKANPRSVTKIFENSVANWGDIIKIGKVTRKCNVKKAGDREILGNIERTTTVEEIVENHLSSSKTDKIFVLSPSFLSEQIKVLQNEDEKKRGVNKFLVESVHLEKEKIANALSKVHYGLEGNVPVDQNFLEDVGQRINEDIIKAADVLHSSNN